MSYIGDASRAFAGIPREDWYAEWIRRQDGVYDPAAATARGLAWREANKHLRTLAQIRKHYRRDRSTGFFKLVPREKAKAPSARDLRIALKLAYANLKPDCDPVVVDHIRNLAA